ncbi:MAG: IS1595 family transposase [Phycisphaeraceae bacterium]|nr:IS1595 family transposase [Phycisphaeraceae bacterium]
MIAVNKKPQTLVAAIRFFDADTADSYLASIKWPDGQPCCPRCGSVNVGWIKSRRRFQCREKACRKQFSTTTGTILEGTHLTSDQWIAAVWMIVNCRMGVSSCEIARTIGCKQQSAWHLLHRVREIMRPANEGKFTGTVEADSTLVGGLLQNMPKARRARITSRHPHAGKTRVHVVRERSTGKVRATIVDGETAAELHRHVRANVEHGSHVHTDAAHAYKSLRGDYHHSFVNHARDEYVRDGVNGCESFFAFLRRGLAGTYIHASPEHLAAYIDEAVYRYNVRHESEWDRFDAAMRAMVGKRLTYKELTGGATR